MNKEEAWDLLCEYTKNKNLRKHGLAVEAAMREYARHFGKDEDRWGITGLIHDFDYEKYPSKEEHPYKGNEILRERGWPEDVRKAIMGHADYTGIARDSLMAKTLYAVDELTGFIIAVALVRPTKSIYDVEVPSVKKKFGQKAFAKSVDREMIHKGIEDLGVDEDEHIQRVIKALQNIATELGLEGDYKNE
ncbi:MAG: HDIG domain-containing protein [Candidatus Marinimicrobia bacterium]|nr:HDIG domain-containing protein [Candidatus Neomarinimicrobiota bacterium]